MEIVVTLDCVDLEAQAEFWLAALAPLAYRRSFDESPYLSLRSPSGPALLLQRVPEPKQGKNRMHLDLDLDLDSAGLAGEVERLERLGARRVSGELDEVGHRWVVLADPEGNEFCVFVPPSRVGRPDR